MLLGLISIFYVGAPTKKPAPEALNEGPRPLTDEQLKNIGKGIDPKSLPKTLSDEQLNNIGKGIDPKSLPTPLTDKQLINLGR